jgi:hypothetical protein
MTTPSQQAVHRLAAAFADYVPYCDLNTANSGHHRGTALILVTYHPSNDRLDIERILSKHAPFDPFVTDGLHGLLLPFERSLSYACQARIGRQSNEEVVSPSSVRQKSLELCDAHLASVHRLAPAYIRRSILQIHNRL